MAARLAKKKEEVEEGEMVPSPPSPDDGSRVTLRFVTCFRRVVNITQMGKAQSVATLHASKCKTATFADSSNAGRIIPPVQKIHGPVEKLAEQIL